MKKRQMNLDWTRSQEVVMEKQHKCSPFVLETWLLFLIFSFLENHLHCLHRHSQSKSLGWWLRIHDDSCSSLDSCWLSLEISFVIQKKSLTSRWICRYFVFIVLGAPSGDLRRRLILLRITFPLCSNGNTSCFQLWGSLFWRGVSLSKGSLPPGTAPQGGQENNCWHTSSLIFATSSDLKKWNTLFSLSSNVCTVILPCSTLFGTRMGVGWGGIGTDIFGYNWDILSAYLNLFSCSFMNSLTVCMDHDTPEDNYS